VSISDKNLRRNITFPKELLAELQKAAKIENRSLNNLVITVLMDYLAKKEN
jgi:predicted HicB family RNase H-like nuclease